MPRDEERRPLLSDQAGSFTSQQSGISSPRLDTAKEEYPSTPLAAVPPHGPKVPCKVCGEHIDLTDRLTSPVVKCSACNESTPIRKAPAGKKYIRCACRCLLVCKSSAQKVSCPRVDCGRVLNLVATNDSFMGTFPSPGLCSVSCGFCSQSFMFNTLSNALARCPNCRKVTSVGAEFARSRGIICLITGLIAAVLCVFFVSTTYSTVATHKGWIAAYVICSVTCLISLMRFIYYITMRVSLINSPGNDSNVHA